MLRILRVETPGGNGPYNGGYGAEYVALFEDQGDRHPAPTTDVPGLMAIYDSGFRFGFKDHTQLDRWFDPPRRDYLRRHGFTVAAYDVPEGDVIFGGRQIAFRRDRAKLVERKSI
jgi:hypothetical protein